MNVIIGLDVYSYSQKKYGVREKPTGEKFRQAYKEIESMVSAIGKNDTIFKRRLNDNKHSFYDNKGTIGFNSDNYFVGYMTISFKTGKPILTNGEMGIISRVYRNLQYPIVGNVVLRLEIEGSFEAGFELILRDSNSILFLFRYSMRFIPKASLNFLSI